MINYTKLLMTVSTGTLLGCTQLSMVLAPTDQGGTKSTVAQRAAAQKSSRASAGTVTDVAELYRLGRSSQDAGDMAQAEKQYEKVLAAVPTHKEALNSMAVIAAQTERLPRAVELFRRALTLDPQAAHIHNNLGYALMLAGRLGEAESELQLARTLNPTSLQTQKNIEQLAQARARTAVAASLVAADTPPAETASGPQLVAIAPNIYELRDQAGATPAEQRQVAGAVAASMTKAPASQLQAVLGLIRTMPNALNGLKIEVSNGVGIRHMARRTAERLAPMGLVTARLTNQPGYRQVKTEIQFGAGQKQAAEELSARLPMSPSVTPVALGSQIQMRLVLGHDLVGKSIAAWVDDAAAPQVSQNVTEGWLLI